MTLLSYAVEGLKAVKYPIRAAAVIVGVVALSAMPMVARAQDALVSKAALTVPGAREDVPAPAPKHADKADKKQKPVAHKSAKASKPEHRKESAAAVPKSTFEDRTAHYFDPLSLTLAPDSRLDPVSNQYNQVTGKFEPPDKQQVAGTPDDSQNAGASSASIENMSMGHNTTVIVPLFQILNNLSPGPAQ